MNTHLQTVTSNATRLPKEKQPGALGDEFLNLEGLLPYKQETAERQLKQALGEVSELIREKKWEDAVTLCHPVAEKFPELLVYHLENPLREKVGFVLGRLGRFDEALKELNLCVQKDPENFMIHSTIAYNAYDSLYAAKNHEIFLSGHIKEDRIGLAHRHFQKAQLLRPDGVTNFYREGMLYKQLEGKVDKALPLFQRAVANWDNLNHTEKEARHQERKNFIKALFQLSSTLLKINQPKESLRTIKRCLDEDEKTNYISLIFKYFALGKVNFYLGLFTEAKDALLFALKIEQKRPFDFVCELLARTYLTLGNPDRALKIIRKVPENKRRPYYRWTEADVLSALGDLDKAKKILMHSQEKDTRSRHKTLIRLAKIEYLLENYHASFKYAQEAGRFYNQKWGNIHYDSLFWQALSAYRSGQNEKAMGLAVELKTLNPNYAKVDLLIAKIKHKG